MDVTLPLHSGVFAWPCHLHVHVIACALPLPVLVIVMPGIWIAWSSPVSPVMAWSRHCIVRSCDVRVHVFDIYMPLTCRCQSGLGPVIAVALVMGSALSRRCFLCELSLLCLSCPTPCRAFPVIVVRIVLALSISWQGLPCPTSSPFLSCHVHLCARLYCPAMRLSFLSGPVECPALASSMHVALAVACPSPVFYGHCVCPVLVICASLPVALSCPVLVLAVPVHEYPVLPGFLCVRPVRACGCPRHAHGPAPLVMLISLIALFGRCLAHLVFYLLHYYNALLLCILLFIITIIMHYDKAYCYSIHLPTASVAAYWPCFR